MTSLDTAAEADRWIAPTVAWEERWAERSDAILRDMLADSDFHRLSRGRHRFPAPAVGALIEQENGHG